MPSRKVVPTLILLTLAIAVILGAVWAWTAYLRSPQYSLARIALALHSGDWEEFTRFVDVDVVSEDIAERVISERLGESGLDLGLGSLGERLTEAAKPIVAEQVERRLRRSVESRQGDTGLREVAGAMWATRDPRRLEVRGDQAFVTVALQVDGETQELDLRMQRRGDRWRVTRVENAEELLAPAE